MEQDNGTVVCSYLISCEGTFDNMYAREARGIVFDKNGQVIARPLTKFFNLNQNADVQYDKIDWSSVTRIMDKRDGSMIHTVKLVDGIDPFYCSANFTLKSKKSYESDVARYAREFIANTANNEPIFGFGFKDYIGLCNEVVARDKTAIFEWTSPTARIVLAYAKDELKLLHVRDNQTGEYMKASELSILAKKYNVPTVDSRADLYDIFETAEGVKKYIDETQDVEGVVVQFANGDMVKVKTAWYMERHQIMTFLRERDIARLALNETLDDQIAMLVGEGVDVSEIKAIEVRVVTEIDLIIEGAASIHNDNKHLSRKDFAMKLGPQGEDHPYFGMLMRLYGGQDPDYKHYFEKYILDEKFSLRQLNLLQSVAEEE